MYVMLEELKQKLIEYYESLGIEVYTHTDARGFQGYFSNNTIEISKKIRKERLIPTLLHEFSHYIHTKLEKNLFKTGGSIDVLFNLSNINDEELCNETLLEELLQVTNFVDKTSLCSTLKCYKQEIDEEISAYEAQIKKDYPLFKKSKKFEEFEQYMEEAKEGLNMPEAFSAYLKLKSAYKERNRISRHINKYKCYYTTPTELFARFIEGLYLDSQKICKIANKTYNRFFELLENDYYHELKNVFAMLQNETQAV